RLLPLLPALAGPMRRHPVAVAVDVAVAVAVAVDFDLDLDLDLRGPSGAAGAADQTPQGRRTGMCGVFRAGFDARSESPAGSADPVRSTGRAGGVCFFAPGFFAQAKKGGSR